MRRRRLPSRRGRGSTTALATRQATSDLRYLEQVVVTQFPLESALQYLRRYLGNDISWRLVEARRGETVGAVREVEVRHRDGGECTMIRGERCLANGAIASFYVPDHLVHVKPNVEGAAAQSRLLGHKDEIILHIPVRGYLRFLPQIFQGEGPVTSRALARPQDGALQRWRSGGGLPHEQGGDNAVETVVDEDPMRRFLFMFQHMNNLVTHQIDHLVDLTDPIRCAPQFLPWLASWVGFELDESLPVHQQRELVRRAIRLMRTRGTRAGVEEMVRVLTSAPVKVEERRRPLAVVLGKSTIIGGRTVVERFHRDDPPGAYLVDPTAHADTSFFTLRLEPRERFQARFGERAAQVLRRITNVVSQERPSHVSFVIRFDERQ